MSSASSSKDGCRKGWYPYLSQAPESFPPAELLGKPEDSEKTRVVGDRKKGTYHVFPVRNQTQAPKKKWEGKMLKLEEGSLNPSNQDLNINCLCCEDPIVPIMSLATSEIAGERQLFYQVCTLLKDILPALRWYHELCISSFRSNPSFLIRGLGIAENLSREAMQMLKTLSPRIYEEFSDLQDSLVHSDERYIT